MSLSLKTSPLWEQLADQSIQKMVPSLRTRDEFGSPRLRTLPLLNAAYQVRHHFHGNRSRSMSCKTPNRAPARKIVVFVPSPRNTKRQLKISHDERENL